MKKSWLGPQPILEKKQNYLIPCVYHFYKNPPQIVKGRGVYVYDSEGKEYLDFYSGVSVHALGHCHPELVEVICEQVKTLQHTTTIYLNESIVKLAEVLSRFYPWQQINKTFFCSSASEAVEGGCLLSSLYTGRSEFIALQNGLHGRTKLGMSLTGLSFWRTDPNPVGGITHVAMSCPTEVDKAINSATSGKIAAFIAEPIQGNGGIIVPPPDYFRKVYQIVKEAGGLFIVDETQSGFGRTGMKFAIEHFGVVPDIVCGGKALGGGTPVGFFSTTDEIAQKYRRPGASTFGGNPVTAEAGAKFLEILERDCLVEKSAEKGRFLEEKLASIRNKFPDNIKEIRGKGLMQGLELHDKKDSAVLTDAVLERVKDNGLFIGKTGPGRNVLTLMPPLIVDEQHIQSAVDKIEKALQEIL